jgi:hypothetical protein
MTPPVVFSLEPKQHHPLGIPVGEGTAKDHNDQIGRSRNTVFFVLIFLKRWMDNTAKGAKRPFGDPLVSMTAYTISTVQVMGSYGCHLHLPELRARA